MCDGELFSERKRLIKGKINNLLPIEIQTYNKVLSYESFLNVNLFVDSILQVKIVLELETWQHSYKTSKLQLFTSNVHLQGTKTFKF